MAGGIVVNSIAGDNTGLPNSGQSIVGVTGRLDVGTIDPVTALTNGLVRFLPNGYTHVTNQNCRLLSVAGTWTLTNNILSSQLFDMNATIKSGATPRNPASMQTFASRPTFDLVNGFSSSGQALSGTFFQPAFIRSAGLRTVNFGYIGAVIMPSITVSAGWTIDLLGGLIFETGQTLVVGQVTELSGMWITPGWKGANVTLATSVHSGDASVEMRHAGAAVFGADAGPTNSTNIALEVQSTTKGFQTARMTTAQRDAAFTATPSTTLNGTLIYVTDVGTGTFQYVKNGAWQSI